MNRTETIEQPSIFRMEEANPMGAKNTRASLTICEESKVCVYFSMTSEKQTHLHLL